MGTGTDVATKKTKGVKRQLRCTWIEVNSEVNELIFHVCQVQCNFSDNGQ
jgi:hypothetical protein